jgi:CubicO group peptidase (beta-lactamase class C family)
MVDFGGADKAADTIVAEFQARGGQPGLAYGIVRGAQLVHTGGLGQRRLGGPPPDADTVFRIASMSKSFTAAAIALLRDEGRLALDDPAACYVPEMDDWEFRPTIRHLLTMTAGFPTDDPWGDRQQGLPLDEFGRFLAGGVSFVREPGIAFEYSNLGYAILGRIITAVSGVPYKDFIRERFMLPLGMTRSGYEAASVTSAEGLALGYRRGPAGWEELALDPYGAFAPMGGVFTTISDLARWVAGLASAAEGAEGAEGGQHPLSAASRREMQQPQVPTLWDWPGAFPSDSQVTAYGFGLTITEDPVLGRIVGHGGGYPGFGTFMRWHPATGTGVIAFANSTYARMQTLTARLLAAVLSQASVSERSGVVPWPATLTARDAVSGLLVSWDQAVADRLFSPNVALDAPYAERRAAIDRVRARIGDFGIDRTYPSQNDTPASCRWRLNGERGRVQVQILLTPERQPRVQSVILAIPPAAASPLAKALDSVVDWMNATDSTLVGCPIADQVTARRLKAAAAWAGWCRVSAYTAGDGEAATTAELAGAHATLLLSVAVDPITGALGQASVSWPPT